jgi:ATP-dependent Clp protease adaptor protein ClpS
VTSPEDSAVPDEDKESQTTTATRSLPAPSKPRQLPPWKVLLHNDDVNDMGYVIDTIAMLTPLKRADAAQRMLEAHLRGVTLLLTTHKERAELYKDQFASRQLTVTIEADE